MSDTPTKTQLSPVDIQKAEENKKKFNSFCRVTKDGVHEDICVLLEGYPNYIIKPLRYKDELNSVGTKKPKLIIATRTEAELDEIFEKIQKIVKDGNDKMENMKKELEIKKTVHPILYNTKKINTISSELKLSFCRAHKLAHMTGRQTVAWLKQCIASTASFDKEGYIEMLDLIEEGKYGLKNDDTPYCVDRFSGTGYRVTYLSDDDYRHQTSVGDVLGIFGYDSFTVIPIPSDSRKTRTDTNKYIFANSAVAIRLDEKALENKPQKSQ